MIDLAAGGVNGSACVYVTDEAAPCPFCGYYGKHWIQWRHVAWVECPKCHACGPTTSRLDGDPLQRAIDLWNECAKEEISDERVCYR